MLLYLLKLERTFCSDQASNTFIVFSQGIAQNGFGTGYSRSLEVELFQDLAIGLFIIGFVQYSYAI